MNSLELPPARARRRLRAHGKTSETARMAWRAACSALCLHFQLHQRPFARHGALSMFIAAATSLVRVVTLRAWEYNSTAALMAWRMARLFSHSSTHGTHGPAG